LVILYRFAVELQNCTKGDLYEAIFRAMA
jgi:hypothetical protein